MKVRLLKNLTSDGVELQIGQIVDASKWKNTKALINSRFIEVAKEEEIATAEAKPKTKKTASKA